MTIVSNSGILRIIPLLLIMILFCPFAYGKILYVDDDGQADFNNIQAAIDDSDNGDTVLVAPGTYTGEGNRDIDFKGKAITVKSEEGPQTCIIDCQGSEDNPHRGFYFHTNEDADSILQGFTITNGYDTYSRGGAIFCDTSSPHIKDCIVTGNAAWYGGGIACVSSNIVIDNCKIIGNWAEKDRGGGILCALGSPHILDCLIEDNTAFNEGGGVQCESSNATFSHCIIRNNSADKGGGIYCWGENTITNCFITGNRAKGSGGGIYCWGEIDLLNCTIHGNRAGSYGGGISFVSVARRINNSIIYGNITNKVIGTEISRPLPGAGGCNPDSIKITNSIVGSDPNGITFPFCFSGEWLYADPLFVQPGYWNANGTPDDPNDDFWVDGDYHLKSQAGRWDTNNKSWIIDDVTSPCIDAGDPNSSIGSEPFPNGGIINMGAYGGTVQASKSLSGTSTYAFEPAQSTIIQTGGIAGVNWTYTLTGQFQLTIDFSAGKAWFSNIEATASDESAPDRKLDLNEVFNLTSLAGTIDPDGSIQFTGQATDGSDIILYITLSDESVSLKAQTTPPPNSADFFIFDLDAVAKRKYGGGTGELDNPYLIYTAEHLNALGAEPNDWYKHFKLMTDIDLEGYSYDHALIAQDIDTDEYYFQGTPFAGVFDGNGHTISHLTITGVSCLGLFGELAYGAELKDLGVKDVNISGSGDFVGGLLGRNSWGAVVTRCYSTGTVNGDDDIGGLVGSNHGNITQCYSTSAASGDYIIGGLLGGNEQEGTLTNCYSTGPINGNDALAGLLGFNLGEVTHCYCTGTVTGNQRVGGLVGWNYGDVASNFWDIQTSGRINMCGSQEESASGCDDSSGLTTAEMQAANIFLDAGWDFVSETANGTEDIWSILEGQDYPRLWWEIGDKTSP